MRYDAILVPGAGVRAGGVLPPWVSRRLERVLEVQQGEPIILLSGGTVHKPPPRDENGFPIFESHAGARYLMDRGIPAGQILTEIMSWDTIGNAYFGKLIHVDPLGANRLLVINSEFHSARCEAVFRWVFGLDPDRSYEWSFEAVPDRDTMAPQVWQARTEKEGRSLSELQPIFERIGSLDELRRWMFSLHRAYAGAPAFRAASGDEVIESY